MMRTKLYLLDLLNIAQMLLIWPWHIINHMFVTKLSVFVYSICIWSIKYHCKYRVTILRPPPPIGIEISHSLSFGMDIPIVRSVGVRNASDIQLILRPDAELIPRVWGMPLSFKVWNNLQQIMLNYINNRENLRYNEELLIQRQEKLRTRHRINTNKTKHTTDSKKRCNMDPPKTWDESICTRRLFFYVAG